MTASKCQLCGKKAKVADCYNQSRGAYSGPLCSAHLERMRRWGDPTYYPPHRSDKGTVRRERGKRYSKGDGYFRVFVPEMPAASKAGYMLEHRYVMSKHLGRELLPTETVHHIDGDRGNNDISNLELRDGQHGKGVKVSDKIKESIAFLERHGYTVTKAKSDSL